MAFRMRLLSLVRLDEIVRGVADVEDLIQDVAIRLAQSIGCEIRPLFATGSARGRSARPGSSRPAALPIRRHQR